MDEEEETANYWAKVVHALQDEVTDLRSQLAVEQNGQETWPESMLESVDAGGGYTYMVPPPARKWAQGWRRRT